MTLEHGDAASSVSYFLWLKRPGRSTKAYLLWSSNTKGNLEDPDQSARPNSRVQDFWEVSPDLHVPMALRRSLLNFLRGRSITGTWTPGTAEFLDNLQLQWHRGCLQLDVIYLLLGHFDSVLRKCNRLNSLVHHVNLYHSMKLVSPSSYGRGRICGWSGKSVSGHTCFMREPQFKPRPLTKPLGWVQEILVV